MKQYYITLPDGSPSGPLSLDALKVMACNGGLTAQHLYCENGATEWRPITELVIIHAATPVIPPVPGSNLQPVTSERPTTYLVPSIVLLALSLMIFYFSIIFAVVAVVYAGLAESAYSDNRLQESAHNGRVAKVWCIVTGVTIGLQILVLLALFFLVFVSAVSSM